MWYSWLAALRKETIIDSLKTCLSNTHSPDEAWVNIMKKSSCELLLHYYPSVTEVEELRSIYIANCVFNNFLSYTAIMLNIVTIHAIRKTSSLPNTLTTLLLNLAVSDIGVGVFVQPFYTSLLVKWLRKNNPGCPANIYGFRNHHLIVLSSLVLWCCGSKCQFIFISDMRNLWLTSVLLLWWSQYGFSVYFFRWWWSGLRSRSIFVYLISLL